MRLILSLVLIAAALPAATAIHCGKLLEVRTGELIPNATILVDGRTIRQAGANVVAPAGAARIDLSQSTCLPGLIDVHVHLTDEPRYSGYEGLGVSVPRQTVTGVKNARATLLAGFTVARNVGASGFSDVALRDGINDGDIEGPRLYVSGPPLGITGGHCDDNLLAPEFHFREEGVADGPWAARAKVRENIKYGADLIKVCASGGVMSKGDQPGTPQYSLEELQAIAAEAHKLGRKTAAHAHGAQSIKDAIRAGIDSVEHSSLIDEEGIALARQHGTFLVFDIYNDDYILAEGAKAGMLSESIEKEKQVGKLQRENFRKAYLAGAKIAFGTDAGVYPHGDNWKQFPIMVEWGMKPIEAIRSATTEAADLLGIGDKAGAIEPGRWADVIAVAGNPLEDISVLGRVHFVMKEGQVYRDDETSHHRH
ncbi:MAG TPA: amidohydrolase family protein [Bryobacteraceae bacterium]|nr:amidohydrolase family protein [Bryobacteraceae bacterium]